MKTIVIAEAGVNHNGSIETAKKLIDVAASAKVDFVKFQTFKAENLATKSADKAKYQKDLTDNKESQFEMLKKLELDFESHIELIKYCSHKKIKFLSTPFDIDSLNMLLKLDIPLIKIPSGELTNLPLLREIGKTKKPIIMSTGMATLDEIDSALKILYNSGAKKNKITVLHCNTEYPTPIKDVNLNAMLTIKKELKVAVGYSDHTLGIDISLAAVVLGATIIEKHFSLDRMQPGPDHKASLMPDELINLVRSINKIEKALGNGEKTPSPSEKKNLFIARKSIVAKKNIDKNKFFTEQNLTTKRPGTGMSPMKWNKIIGQKSKKNYKIDEFIYEEDYLL